ncbi:MAG TPA: universal stress protein [Polyangiaceae bacterium]|nr:universal stress protein [Polyangiaceae bacterium]
MKHEGPKMRRVLCALDMGRSSSTSLSLASLLAERFHASVDALYATPAVPAFDHSAARVKRLISEHNAQDRMTRMLADIKRRVCISSFVTRGDATAVILAHSKRQGSDLIVMASSPNRHFAGGRSTIEAVTAQAACAVLTAGDAFEAAPLRQILLPVGPAGVEPDALSWVTALAERFNAAIGVLRIGQPRSGLWKLFTTTGEAAPRALGRSSVEYSEMLSAMARKGIETYEIEHPGGGDASAVSNLCGSGRFDAVVVGLPPIEHGESDSNSWVSPVRLRTSVPILSVRSHGSRALFASSQFRAQCGSARSTENLAQAAWRDG